MDVNNNLRAKYNNLFEKKDTVQNNGQSNNSLFGAQETDLNSVNNFVTKYGGVSCEEPEMFEQSVTKYGGVSCEEPEMLEQSVTKYGGVSCEEPEMLEQSVTKYGGVSCEEPEMLEQSVTKYGGVSCDEIQEPESATPHSLSYITPGDDVGESETIEDVPPPALELNDKNLKEKDDIPVKIDKLNELVSHKSKVSISFFEVLKEFLAKITGKK